MDFSVEVLKVVDVGQWKIRIHRPHSLPDLFHKALRAGAGATDDESQAAVHPGLLIEKMPHQDWPSHRTRRFNVHTIVVRVRQDTDNLRPVVLGTRADPLAEGTGRRAPVFARHILSDEGNRPLVVDVRPGEIAAGNKRSA